MNNYIGRLKLLYVVFVLVLALELIVSYFFADDGLQSIDLIAGFFLVTVLIIYFSLRIIASEGGVQLSFNLFWLRKNIEIGWKDITKIEFYKVWLIENVIIYGRNEKSVIFLSPAFTNYDKIINEVNGNKPNSTIVKKVGY